MQETKVITDFGAITITAADKIDWCSTESIFVERIESPMLSRPFGEMLSMAQLRIAVWEFIDDIYERNDIVLTEPRQRDKKVGYVEDKTNGWEY
jgi:hypothetical protein